MASGADQIVPLVADVGADAVHRLGDLVGGMTRDIFCQGSGKHFASGATRPAGEPLDLLEYLVRNRYRRFHTKSITGSGIVQCRTLLWPIGGPSQTFPRACGVYVMAV